MVWCRLSHSVQLACLCHFLTIFVGNVLFTNTKAAWKNISRATTYTQKRRVSVIRKKGEMNWNTLPLGSMTKPKCRVSSNLRFVNNWCSPINCWPSWDSLGKGSLSTGIGGGDCHDPENTFSKWCHNIHIFNQCKNSVYILTSISIIILKIYIFSIMMLYWCQYKVFILDVNIKYLSKYLSFKFLEVFILVRCRDWFCRWAHLPVSGGGVRTNWTGGCEISEL